MTMKRKLLLLIAALLPIVACAYDAEIDGIYYNFKGDEATVTYQIYQSSYPYYISDYTGAVAIPESVTYNGKTYIVTSIGSTAFSNCSDLTTITIPNSVTNIYGGAFSGCKLRNVLIKRTTPPSGSSAFSNQTYYHTTLYIPTGSWDAYAYDDNWYLFHNIREVATEEEQLTIQQAYTMMDAEAFTYSVYDPVNDRISTISSIGIDENNPNHSWQIIEEGGNRYLYNMGAKKFVETASNGTFTLTDTPTSINMGNGDKRIILGAQTAKQWALVSNEHMNVEDAIIDGIRSLTPTLSKGEGEWFDLSGRKLGSKPAKQGLYIMNGKKVVIK